MNQAVIMRFLASRSVIHARRATMMNVLVFLPIGTVAVSNSGWLARAMENMTPGVITDLLPNGSANGVLLLLLPW